MDNGTSTLHIGEMVTIGPLSQDGRYFEGGPIRVRAFAFPRVKKGKVVRRFVGEDAAGSRIGPIEFTDELSVAA